MVSQLNIALMINHIHLNKNLNALRVQTSTNAAKFPTTGPPQQ